MLRDKHGKEVHVGDVLCDSHGMWEVKKTDVGNDNLVRLLELIPFDDEFFPQIYGEERWLMPQEIKNMEL